MSADAAKLIEEECDAIKAMLLAKNKAYGNSALDPLRVFSKASATEQILVRIDDKLSRLSRGRLRGPETEDVEADLLGYLVLLRVSRRLYPVANAGLCQSLSADGSICGLTPGHHCEHRS